MKALPLLLAMLASCAPPPASAPGYEFVGTLRKVGLMSDLVGTAALTTDRDPRWIADFSVEKVVRGMPPLDVEGKVRYAIHSPALSDLDGGVGRSFRVRGELVDRGGSAAHAVQFLVP